MNTLIIFGAKYLWIISAALFLIIFLSTSRKKQMAIFALLVLPLSYALAKLAGHFYYDSRPFVTGEFVPLIPHVQDNGFPSDHTLLAGALAAVAMPFKRKWAYILWIIAILVGISRVLAGVHHAIDVIVSLAISALVALVIYSSGKFR